MPPTPTSQRGSTLIELSIFLVIISLIARELLIVPPALAEDNTGSTALKVQSKAGTAEPDWDTSARCDEKAKAFWNALAPEDKQRLKSFFTDHPYVAAELPEAISALKAGSGSQAQQIIRDHYGVNGKLAAAVTTLMAYANGIEAACPADEKGVPPEKGETHGAK